MNGSARSRMRGSKTTSPFIHSTPPDCDACEGAHEALRRVRLVVLLVVDEGRLRERLDDVLELVADDDGHVGVGAERVVDVVELLAA